MTENLHDRLVRGVFGRPEHAAAEFRAVMPPALLARIDLDTLTPVPESFIDATLRDREADLLFTVRSRSGQESLVYLLFEHQSTFDPWLPLRLLEYQLRIWERWRREHPDARRLPRIVPVVLFHGERAARPWSGSTRFDALLDEWGDDAELAELSVDFGFLLDDLTRSSDEELRGRAMGAVSLVTLLALKHARTAQDLEARLLSWASLMSEAARAPGGRDALMLVLRYLSRVAGRVPATFLRTKLLPVLDEDVREMTMTLAEELIAEGRVDGQRKMLLKLLQRRFGQVPAAITERVEAATIEQLDVWATRILDARSLDEMFAG